jgi:hypothetical protein
MSASFRISARKLSPSVFFSPSLMAFIWCISAMLGWAFSCPYLPLWNSDALTGGTGFLQAPPWGTSCPFIHLQGLIPWNKLPWMCYPAIHSFSSHPESHCLHLWHVAVGAERETHFDCLTKAVPRMNQFGVYVYMEISKQTHCRTIIN